MTVAVAWKIILLILVTSLQCSAIFSRASSIPNGTNISTYTHSSIYTAFNLSLGTIKPATRQLIEHDAFMYIRYADHERLPSRFCRYVTMAALLRIVTEIEFEGEEGPLNERFTQIEGTVLLIADHAPHSPTRDLTWGILGEAISILQDFLRSRPFLMQAQIFEGLDGRGIPIGEISIGPYPVPTVQRGSVQAS